MALVNLTFEQRTWIRKWYSKTKNVTEVLTRCRNEFETPPPTTRVTVTNIRDEFEADGTVQNVNKGQSGKPRRSTHDESVATVL
jgi:hypothetical protein